MLVAFAARRAIDRGVALGYLEPLLVQRFGRQNQAAVATIVTASRNPVSLDALIADLKATSNTAGQELVNRLIDVQKAQVNIDQLRTKFDTALGGFGLFLVNSALEVALGLGWTLAGQRMIHGLAGDLFDRLQRLSPLYHSARPSL